MDFDVDSLIKTFGYLGVWTIIFAETGILFGVLLPGDSLLIAAGILAAQGHFDIGLMTFGCFIAAFVGNLLGFKMGVVFGKPLLEKYGPQLVPPEKIAKTYEVLRRHDRLGIVVARFLPAARTFAPFLAGVVRMPYFSFVVYSFIGAIVWGVGLPLFGYYVGEMLPPWFVELMIIPVLAFILAMVFYPIAKKRYLDRRNKAKIAQISEEKPNSENE